MTILDKIIARKREEVRTTKTTSSLRRSPTPLFFNALAIR